jgi:AraC-like DNA-binding protein
VICTDLFTRVFLAQANRFPISPHYLQKLFESEGSTVTDWIQTRRLEHCRNDLMDPRFVGTSITAIAARGGLTHSSYFSRLFRSAYGSAPPGVSNQRAAVSHEHASSQLVSRHRRGWAREALRRWAVRPLVS